MKKIFSILLASVALSSCVDTVILPENKTLDEDYWQTKSEVEAIVAAAYSQLRDGNLAITATSFQRNAIVWGSFRSDEMVVSSDFRQPNNITIGLSEVYTMNLYSTNIFTQWSPLYSCINYCNLVLEKGEATMDIDPSYTEGDWLANKAQVTALKALCYFYLVRVFRDVPVTPHAYLNSSDDLLVVQQAPEKVLQMCIDDLTSVVDGAPRGDAYGDSRDRGLFNVDGINALLADIYLWRASVHHSAEDYQKCVEYCDKIIAAKKAAHVAQSNEAGIDKEYWLAGYDKYYNAIWGMNEQNAEESIFEIQYKANGINNNVLANMYYALNLAKPEYGYLKTTSEYGCVDVLPGATNFFKNTSDQRLYDFIFDAGTSSKDKQDQYAIRKFSAKTAAKTITVDPFNSGRNDFLQNWIIYRLTDIMLMKAEALVQLEQPEEAFKLIAAVYERAKTEGNPLKYDLYKDEMEELVLMERARELCFEGKRWFDLLRYNYRRMEGVQYDKLMSEISDNPNAFPKVSEGFYNIAFRKYGAGAAAMKVKIPTEPYLYMPINNEEIKINTALKQNPAFPDIKK